MPSGTLYRVPLVKTDVSENISPTTPGFLRVIGFHIGYRGISVDHVRFEAFKAVTMKNGVFCDVTPRAVVRTDVSEELSASFIRVTRIGELGNTK
jgi:hypothetical protein